MYLLLKAVHIIALLAWIGGMLLQVFMSRALAAGQRPGGGAVIDEAVRWDRWMTTPAMLLAWACGLALANGGQWLGAPWLSVKLVLVVVLSALHGMQSGSLRRMAADPARRPSARSRYGGAVILGTVAAIVLLVVLKP
jgi:putative membrane protein